MLLFAHSNRATSPTVTSSARTVGGPHQRPNAPMATGTDEVSSKKGISRKGTTSDEQTLDQSDGDKDGTTKDSESPAKPKINANQPGDNDAPGDESTEDTAGSARNASHNDKPPVGGDDANPTATNKTTFSAAVCAPDEDSNRRITSGANIRDFFLAYPKRFAPC